MTDSSQTETTMTLADKYMFPTYSRQPITLIRGQGSRVWDENGKEYIDFVGGIAVCALGHSSPIVSMALADQSQKLVHVSNLYYTRPQMELARMLVENSFADRVFFCNSGAEANEAAIKLARRYSREKFGRGRYAIISATGSFHGRTMGTLSATGQTKIQAGYEPLLEGFIFVPYNDLKSLESAIDESVCAIMLEPLQGEGGVISPGEGYLQGVNEICKKKDLLLIFDEVQVGMGRTGKLFAHEHFGITPHIMTLAKALGNGLPIGAMLSVEELSSAFGAGSHASTFGGTPLVTAVARAVLEALLEEGWIDHCRETGIYFKGRLEYLKGKYPEHIMDVRGMGLILGMEIDRPAASIIDVCREKGFLITSAQEKVLRFIPPLIIEKAEIDLLIENLDAIFDDIKS